MTSAGLVVLFARSDLEQCTCGEAAVCYVMQLHMQYPMAVTVVTPLLK
jgi:hypothetical protein